MTSVACAFSTARHVGSCVGWLHSWDNLRTTQCALRCMRSERYKSYVMPKQHPVSQTVFTVSTKSRLQAPHSEGAWWLCKIKLGRFGFINQRNAGYQSNRRNSSIYIPSSGLHLHSLFLLYWTHRQQLTTPYPELSRHHMMCTKQYLSFKNTPDNLHIFLRSFWACFCYVQLYHNPNASDADSFSTRSDGTSVSNGSMFGTGRFYRSAWQWPYHIKNRQFFKWTT